MPTSLAAPYGDAQRVFVSEKNSGLVRVIKNGVLLPAPFVDASSKVGGTTFSGLFSITFHPDYWSNGYVYLCYRHVNTNLVVERYTVSAGNPDVTVSASGTTIISIPVPGNGHEGGQIAFGPEGYLYISIGDGSPQNFAQCVSQDGQVLLGKMLRLDVDGGTPYAIPASNPFVGDPSIRDEVWALGLRNPWRFSFDRETGDMYLGDNGEDLWEEIDFEPGGFAGGRNYGWPIEEATHCFAAAQCSGTPPCGSPLLADPIREYNHAQGCSVIGGYVYRGCAIPSLSGTYFYADFCGGGSSNTIFSFNYAGGQVLNLTDRTAELNPPGPATISQVVTLGEDGLGELYVIDYGQGEVFKITPATGLVDCNANGVADACDIALGVSIDCNVNGIPDECEPPLGPIAYCTAKVNSLGCTPAIGWNGSPSVSSSSGFVIHCQNTLNQKNGLLLFGLSGRASLPFGGGVLCMGPPARRTVGLNSGGSPLPAADCTGSFALDFNAYAAGATQFPQLQTPGTLVDCQWWGRDPGFAPPANVILSAGLEFVLCP